MTPPELLHVYDEQVRATFVSALPGGWTAEVDGALVRCLTTDGEGFAQLTRNPTELGSDELAALVDRTVGYFRDRDLRFEWKTFDHDRADLLALLRDAGLEPEPHEALVLGEAAPLAVPPVLPDGLTMREVTGRADLERIAELSTEVWGEDHGWLADSLQRRLESEEQIRVFVVADGDLVVSAAWLVLVPGTPVAGLWGGSTLAAYRGRGVYRALVAERARLAVDLGYRYLQVDASDDSRPILERLGLSVIGGTVPYVGD